MSLAPVLEISKDSIRLGGWGSSYSDTVPGGASGYSGPSGWGRSAGGYGYGGYSYGYGYGYGRDRGYGYGQQKEKTGAD